MGTTSEKLTYLNETKQELKQKINNLGGSIDDNTTFRQYANQLQTIYDNLPKTEYQEGSNITLENTLKGKLDFEDGIVGIGDTSQKSYQGYNLLPSVNTTRTINGITFTHNADGSITANGTASANALYPINVDGTSVTRNVPLAAESYVIVDSVGDYTNYFCQLSDGTNFANTGSGGAVGKSNIITLSSQANVSALVYIRSGVTINNVTFKPMVVTSSNIDKSYEPYVGGTASPNPSYPQEIEVVRGKNRLNNTLTNKTQQGIEFIVNEDKTIKANGTATGTSGVVLGQVELTANKTYILSGCASNGGSGKYTLSISPNGETTRLVDDIGSGVTYTPTTSGIYDIRLNYWYGFNIQNLTFKPMIEERKCSYSIFTF